MNTKNEVTDELQELIFISSEATWDLSNSGDYVRGRKLIVDRTFVKNTNMEKFLDSLCEAFNYYPEQK